MDWIIQQRGEGGFGSTDKKVTEAINPAHQRFTLRKATTVKKFLPTIMLEM
jgi:hypothetical protein